MRSFLLPTVIVVGAWSLRRGKTAEDHLRVAGDISKATAEVFVQAQFDDWLGNCTALLESMSEEFLWEDINTITDKNDLMHDCEKQESSPTTIYKLDILPLFFLDEATGEPLPDYRSIVTSGLQDIELPGMGWMCFDFAIKEELEISPTARFGITSKYWGGHYTAAPGRCSLASAANAGQAIEAEVFSQEAVNAFAEAQFEDYLGNCTAFVESMSDEFLWEDGNTITSKDDPTHGLMAHCQKQESSPTTILSLKTLPLFFMNEATGEQLPDFSRVVIVGLQEIELPGYGWMCFNFGVQERLEVAVGSRFGFTSKYWGGHFTTDLGRCPRAPAPTPATACPFWCSLRLCIAQSCIDNCGFCQ